MKKLLAVLLLALVLVACGGEKSVTVTGSFETPHNEGEAYQTATVTLVDGKFTEVTIDEYYPAKDAFKKALGADYGMVVASPIGKEWFEQAEALEQIELFLRSKLTSNVWNGTDPLEDEYFYSDADRSAKAPNAIYWKYENEGTCVIFFVVLKLLILFPKSIIFSFINML